LNPERQREPRFAQAQRWSHADGMTSKQVFLQQKDIVRFNALVGKLAEAGVHAVHGPAFRYKLFHAFAGANNIPPRFARERQRMDFAKDDALGIIQRQIIASEGNLRIGTQQILKNAAKGRTLTARIGLKPGATEGRTMNLDYLGHLVRLAHVHNYARTIDSRQSYTWVIAVKELLGHHCID
jgi:hypothetical protein